MKKCAVIVAAYKAAPYIGEMIQSFDALKKLDGWEWEIRIGVDACPETARELEILGIDYWFSPENVGAYVIRNSLIAKGRADCYAIFDADDIFEPDYLFKLIPHAVKHGFSCSHKIVFNEKGILETNRRFGGGIPVFTHEVLEKLGGFKSDRVSSDLDFTLRAMQSGVEIYITPETLWSYRRLETSLTGNPATNCRSAYRAEIEARQDISRVFDGVKITPETTDLEKAGGKDVLVADKKRVSVIAFAPSGNCPYRKRNWEWLREYWLSFGFELVEITVPDGEKYNKALAAHLGAKAASGDVLIFADADVYMDKRAVNRAVGAVCSGMFGWAAPNKKVLRHTETESETILNGGGIVRAENEPYVGQLAGGLFIVSRKCWDETAGFDVRFEGWGGEDSAYSVVLAQRGDGWKPRRDEILFHLWHPEQISKKQGAYLSLNETNNQLMHRYRLAAQSGENAESIVDKSLNNQRGNEMKIRIEESTRIDGIHCEKGKIVDAQDKTAADLIRWKIAAPATEGEQRDAEAVKSIPVKSENKDDIPKMRRRNG